MIKYQLIKTENIGSLFVIFIEWGLSLSNNSIPENNRYPYINTFILLMFCGYVITWYLQLGYRKPFLGEIRFEFIYAACLSVIALLVWRKEDWSCPLLKYVFLYFVVIIYQVVFSYDFETSWDVFINRILKFSFMAFFIISFVRSPRDLKWFLAAFLLACFKMGQEGFWGKLTGSMMWESQGVMRLHGVTPLYFHPNSFSGMANGTLPFIYFLMPLVGKYLKSLLFFLAIFSLNIIMFTGSRTGYLAFFFFLIFIFIKIKNKKKFILSISMLAVLAIPFIHDQYVERFNSIFTGIDKEGESIIKRKQIIRDAVVVFNDNPMGIGVSAFPSVRMKLFGREQDTHNLYLEIATNLGIPGIIIFSLLLYNLVKINRNTKYKFKSRIKILQKNNTTGNYSTNIDAINDYRFLAAVCDSVLFFIVVRLLLGFFGMDLYEIYWWFAIGVTVALYNIEKNGMQ